VILLFRKHFGQACLLAACFLQGGDTPEFEAVVILSFTGKHENENASQHTYNLPDSLKTILSFL
jgi:hypothetical protein